MKVPMSPPRLDDLLQRTDLPRRIGRLLEIGPLWNGEYIHWDELRHQAIPADLTLEECWMGIKMARRNQLRAIPLLDRERQPFAYSIPDPMQRLLHEVDREASGRIQVAEEVTNPATRDRYIVSSLIEESITSSQLEGASTTSKVAREMLRTGRDPRDLGERMILNNFRAMSFVREKVHTPLTPEFLLELHRIVTDQTLDDASDAGKLRGPDDPIVVEDGYGNTLHVPPEASELPARMEAMCQFANDLPHDRFVHPVIRAITLHFWLAYDHPFVDGNGRTARALFYWSMACQGYWLTEYLSISRILRKAPAQYSRSFLHSETDGNDLTYFILYQLDVLRRAVEELRKYLSRKIAEVRAVEGLLRESSDLNHRQVALLGHAVKHPDHAYTIQSHQTSHNIVYQTARTDLMELASRGLLIQRKRGRRFHFLVPADLSEILQGPDLARG